MAYISRSRSELYFVFMKFDPEYQRLLSHRTEIGEYEVDMYLNRKHDELLAATFELGSYKKAFSMVIVDGFSVQITDDQIFNLFALSRCITYVKAQANALRAAKGVRVVEKNLELT